MLETLSHGIIKSGFFAAFVQFVRMGKYAFTTKHFCELTRAFAEDPLLEADRIMAYDVDRFWDRGGRLYVGLHNTNIRDRNLSRVE